MVDKVDEVIIVKVKEDFLTPPLLKIRAIIIRLIGLVKEVALVVQKEKVHVWSFGMANIAILKNNLKVVI